MRLCGELPRDKHGECSTPHPGPLSTLQRHTSSGCATFSPSDAEKGIEAEREKRARGLRGSRFSFATPRLGVLALKAGRRDARAAVHALRRLVCRFTTGWPDFFSRLRKSANNLSML